jgi:hypothetical protein
LLSFPDLALSAPGTRFAHSSCTDEGTGHGFDNAFPHGYAEKWWHIEQATVSDLSEWYRSRLIEMGWHAESRQGSARPSANPVSTDLRFTRDTDERLAVLYPQVVPRLVHGGRNLARRIDRRSVLASDYYGSGRARADTGGRPRPSQRQNRSTDCAAPRTSASDRASPSPRLAAMAPPSDPGCPVGPTDDRAASCGPRRRRRNPKVLRRIPSLATPR